MTYTFRVYNSIYKDGVMIQTNFSNNLVSNVITKEVLDETLSQCKVTLALTYSEEFAPGTRFFIDICDGDGNVLASPNGEELCLDFIVERDMVEPIALSEKDKFLHHLNLVESSATAQQVLLPNSSLTWELKDTLLRYIGYFPQEEKGGSEVTFSSNVTSKTEKYIFGTWSNFYYLHDVQTFFRGYFGTDKNTKQNMPIVIDKDTTSYLFTYNIPEIYLRRSSSISQRSGAFLGYNVSYTKTFDTNVHGDGNDNPIRELSSVTYIYKGSQIVHTVYHNGDETLIDNGDYIQTDSFPNAIDFTGDLIGYQPYKRSNDNTVYFSGTPSIALGQNFSIPFTYEGFTAYSSINVRNFDNYNIGTSNKSFNIDLMQYKEIDDDGNIKVDIRFKTVPIVRTLKFSNGAFGVLTDDVIINPTIAKDVALVVKNTELGYVRLPNTSSGGSLLEYEYPVQLSTQTITENVILKKSVPYSLYDLFYKLQIKYLQIPDNGLSDDELYATLPYQMDNETAIVAKDTTLPEITFSQKSLWDAYKYIFNFMGRIPKIKAQQDSPKFIVTSKILGGTAETIQGKSNKLSVYNSKDISEFVTEIRNEYNNVINSTGIMTEYLHCVSSDNSFVSTDNFCLQPTYRIDRVAEFRIIRTSDGKNVDATDLFFEKSIYDMLSGYYYLSSDDTGNFTYEGTIPNQGMCLYYEHNTTTIGGYQYKCPDKYTSVIQPNTINCYAIKNFIWAAFNRSVNGDVGNPFTNKEECYVINPNDYIYVLRYVPIVNTESSIVRPDIRKFALNANVYRYPTYQQRSQASEYMIEAYKLGNKAWGELIRMSNTIYSISEWFRDATQKHNIGELYRIEQSGRDPKTGESYTDNNLYYINTVETEYTNAYATQSLTLSKDFNRLSQYIGLDSQSRFYEVPIKYCDRYVKENIFLYIYTEFDELPSYMSGAGNFTSLGIKTLLGYIFKLDNKYPEAAEVTFHMGGDNGTKKTVILPVAVFPEGGNLQYHFECRDNFTPGIGYIGNDDFLSNASSTLKNIQMIEWGENGAEMKMVTISDTSNDVNSEYPYYFPVTDTYCDQYGRVKSYEYTIGLRYKQKSTKYSDEIREDMQLLPLTEVYVNRQDESKIIGKTNLLAEELKLYNSERKYVFKDAAEKLLFSINHNIATGSDRFSYSKYVWEANANVEPKGTKFVALSKEINKFGDSGFNDENVISTYENAAELIDYDNNEIKISEWLGGLTDDKIDDIKAIALVSYDNNEYSLVYKKPLLYRNVGGMADITKPDQTVVTVKQQKIANWKFEVLD